MAHIGQCSVFTCVFTSVNTSVFTSMLLLVGVLNTLQLRPIYNILLNLLPPFDILYTCSIKH